MQQSITAFRSLSLEQAREYVRSINDDFIHYSPHIVNIIDEYEKSGNYPYNRDIEDICANDLFKGVTNDEDRPLSRIVYNSQSFRHARIEHERIEKLRSDGFMPAENNPLESVINDYKWFTVILEGQNFLGFTVRSNNKMKLIKHNDRYYWMKPKARSRGIPANPTQYFRPLK